MSYLRLIGSAFVSFISVLCMSPVGQSQETEKVSPCELKKDPPAYNQKSVQITGFVSHGFEDFTLFDPSCQDWPHVWLEYGGTVKSGTMYCCGVTADRKRPKQLQVEGIRIPLVDDDHFEEFDRLIQRKPDSVVHATVIGRFFAGRQMRYPRRTFWGGYGHMGCCSLLAIQQVLSVDPQDSKDLDYRASPEQPRADKVGCGYRLLLPIQSYDNAIRAQQIADAGGHDWAFDDPRHVATDSLRRVLKIDEKPIEGFKQTLTAQGRIVYEWSVPEKKVSYMIVVSRPYWLSFYSKDATRVAWIALAAYESSCGKGNSVIRIR